MPQFLDLLEYGQRLFGKKGRTLSQQELETIHKNFAVFFSNTAILVDSLNQTNRQFVQVPAFHLPSFEVPSQIMAYYTAMAYRILKQEGIFLWPVHIAQAGQYPQRILPCLGPVPGRR